MQPNEMKQLAFTASHFQASEAGMQILQNGGTAIEAMVAAAAAIAVAYPHMNSLGGDGFWLIHEPGKQPIAINAAGVSAVQASAAWYQAQGFAQIPSRGSAAALTMAGTVAGWQLALEISEKWQSGIGLDNIFNSAIHLARHGISVTESLAAASRKTVHELSQVEGFSERYLPNGNVLNVGETLRNEPLADLLQHLSVVGLDDFYRGKTADCIAAAFAKTGSPLTRSDLAAYYARQVKPLSVTTRKGTFYNLPLPTQGIASLLILALFDRCFDPSLDETTQLHLLVEATKQAFRVRNAEAQDASIATKGISRWLDESALQKLAAEIDLNQAAPWPNPAIPGDTIWMGARDKEGRMVSFIQSIYWEFGSGLVIPELGLLWNNRGVSFSLEQGAINALRGGIQPFHTLNPALAHLNDGRVLAYGTMGGEGQPQTQAAIIWRYLYQQLSLSDAIAAPRWLLGRTWGDNSHNLKIEADMPEHILSSLQQRGHEIQTIPACSELMGHAGAIAATADAVIDVATDPRSDGAALTATLN
jgi:oxamate amidohydrolase